MALPAFQAKTYKKNATGQYTPAAGPVPGFDPASQAGIQAGSNSTSGYYGGGLSTGTTGGAAPQNWTANMTVPSRPDLFTPPPPGPPSSVPSAAPSIAPPPPQASEGILSGPGYYEEFYKAHGQDLMNPSNTERLFDLGMEGSNPYYDYAAGRATDSINAASRARGGFNSGAALQQIGNQNAYLRGQQARDLNMLATGADQQKLGRYGLTGQMADTAQGRQEKRIGDAFDREFQVGKAQADTTGGYYTNAGQFSQAPGMAAIEALLKAKNFSAAEIKQYMDIIGQVGGIATKAA